MPKAMQFKPPKYSQNHMKVHKTFKTELKPNNAQKTLLEKHAGCARFAYNWMLGLLMDDFKNDKKLKPNAMSIHKLWVQKKNSEFFWAKELSVWPVQYALRNAENAFKRFFKKQSKFPKFKKKGIKDSFSLNHPIIITNSKIQLPKIGKVRLKEYGYIPEGKPKSATITKKAGRWFVSVLYEVEIPENSWTDETLGVDLGIKTLATCSDGTVIKGSGKLKNKEASLKRLQRKFSRQVKGSNSRERTKRKIQNLHFKISNHRKDILHKATSILMKTKLEGIIAIEDLNVKGMLKNHCLAKAISNCGLYEFRRQLEYKAKWYGKRVKIVDRFFPSSKLCSCCGSLKEDLNLSERTYECDCGNIMDRDLNAAINIKNYIPKTEQNTVSSTEIYANGEGNSVKVSRSKRSPSKKFEINGELK